MIRARESLEKSDVEDFIIYRAKDPVGVDAICGKMSAEFTKLDQEALSGGLRRKTGCEIARGSRTK